MNVESLFRILQEDGKCEELNSLFLPDEFFLRKYLYSCVL